MSIYGVFTPEGDLLSIGRTAYDAQIGWERNHPRQDFDAHAQRDGLRVEAFEAVRK